MTTSFIDARDASDLDMSKVVETEINAAGHVEKGDVEGGSWEVVPYRGDRFELVGHFASDKTATLHMDAGTDRSTAELMAERNIRADMMDSNPYKAR